MLPETFTDDLCPHRGPLHRRPDRASVVGLLAIDGSVVFELARAIVKQKLMTRRFVV
jgi:hypothetical protein